MLFYRKKILLSIIEVFGGSVEKLKFQKYLFLVIEKLPKKYYHFVPCKYGCFSFESYSDKRSLEQEGYLEKDHKSWTLKKEHIRSLNMKGFSGDVLSQIKRDEKEYILTMTKEYGRLSKKILIRKVYSHYPYYAINTEMLKGVGLSTKDQKEILNKKPEQKKKCLFTIGYEGRSIDEYLNIFIEKNVKTLCDVRLNPFSRKYGFSKKALEKKITDFSMEYVHLPALGFPYKFKKKLKK